jgi:hypothetical protein
MSYYEDRIKALEDRIEEMAKRERFKAIPVEARLVELIAELKTDNTRLKAEVERLTKAGDAMAAMVPAMVCCQVDAMEATHLMEVWHFAKEGKSQP